MHVSAKLLSSLVAWHQRTLQHTPSRLVLIETKYIEPSYLMRNIKPNFSVIDTDVVKVTNLIQGF